MIPSGAAHNNLARLRKLLTPRNSGDPGIQRISPTARLSGSLAQRWLSQIKNLQS
jgi:hypothetical protein